MRDNAHTFLCDKIDAALCCLLSKVPPMTREHNLFCPWVLFSLSLTRTTASRVATLPPAVYTHITQVMQAVLLNSKYYTRRPHLVFLTGFTVRSSVCVCLFACSQGRRWGQAEAGVVGRGQSQAHGSRQPDSSPGQRTHQGKEIKMGPLHLRDPKEVIR